MTRSPQTDEVMKLFGRYGIWCSAQLAARHFGVNIMLIVFFLWFCCLSPVCVCSSVFDLCKTCWPSHVHTIGCLESPFPRHINPPAGPRALLSCPKCHNSVQSRDRYGSYRLLALMLMGKVVEEQVNVPAEAQPEDRIQSPSSSTPRSTCRTSP